MSRATGVVAILALTTVGLPAGTRADERAEDAETFFERAVRPTLAGTCFPCHGGKKTSGGLRVDSRAGLVKGGESGPAIVPGGPATRLLGGGVRHAEDLAEMPPGKRLPDAVVTDL